MYSLKLWLQVKVANLEQLGKNTGEGLERCRHGSWKPSSRMQLSLRSDQSQGPEGHWCFLPLHFFFYLSIEFSFCISAGKFSFSPRARLGEGTMQLPTRSWDYPSQPFEDSDQAPFIRENPFPSLYYMTFWSSPLSLGLFILVNGDDSSHRKGVKNIWVA